MTVNAGLRVDVVHRHDNLFDVDVQDSVEVGPRFGINYMVTRDQRNLVRRVGAGSTRRSRRTPRAPARTARATSISTTTTWTEVRDRMRSPASTSVQTNRIIDPDRHQPYLDEWTLGYRRQLPGQSVLDAGFVHRAWTATAPP